jgi:S-formylglutathione hydrolase FrmB
MLALVLAAAAASAAAAHGSRKTPALAAAGNGAAARADALAAACTSTNFPPASPRVVKGQLDGVRFDVLLPPDYASSRRAYPVLYLLNGATQDQNAWVDPANTDLFAFTARLPADQQAIVVMPAGDPFGLNIDWRDGRHPWDTRYIDELIPYIDSHFRTLADRSHRAIAGLSAGAFTSLHDAARHPDLFAAVGGFSGAADLTTLSPVGETAWFPITFITTLCAGEPPTDPGPTGDPIRDDIYWHNANPGDMVENLNGLSIYMASGDGVPCDTQDLRDLINDGNPLTLFEPDIYVFSRAFERDLNAGHVPHVADFYGCGVHTYRYWQRDLHRFWPQMMAGFGKAAAATFSYRTADPRFEVWGWSFSADPQRGDEFLDIHDASRHGLSLIGSGTETVTTDRYFTPGAPVTLTGAQQRTVTADATGRVKFTVNLGRAHRHQQYTPQARAAGEDTPGYFTERAVTFSPTG